MNLLPEEVIPSVLCYAICRGQGDIGGQEGDKGVDIIYCNSNGYLVEVYKKKIVNSCHIIIEDAEKLFIYYKYFRKGFHTYYLVRNDNGMLIVVKKWNNMLMVVKSFKNVRDCKIFDFENRGYPQIGIYYMDSDIRSITHLSEFDNFKLGIENCFSHSENELPEVIISSDERSNAQEILSELHETMDDDQSDNAIITDFLSKKLEGMEMYKNELNYEIHNLNKMLLNKIEQEVSPPSCVPDENESGHWQNTGNKITNTWFRIYNSYWIIGIEFFIIHVRDVADIGVVLRGRDFSRCVCKFFRASHAGVSGFRCNADGCGDANEGDNYQLADDNRAEAVTSQGDEDVDSLVEGGRAHAGAKRTGNATRILDEDYAAVESGPPRSSSKYIAVLALNIPPFERKDRFSAAFTFLCNGLQLHTDAFHLFPEHILCEKYQIFNAENEMSLSEDLMTCQAVSRRVNLCIRLKYNLGISLEDVLCATFGFKKRNLLGETFLLKETGALRGTSMSMKQIHDSFLTWKLHVFVRDISVLFIVVKALRNELPVPISIRVDEDQ